MKMLKDILKFLFPEYQIKACVEERGFIAKSQPNINLAQQTTQVYIQENIQQQAVPASMQTMQGAESATSRYARTGKNIFTPAKENTKSTFKANDAFEGLADALKEYWVGSEKDRNAICKAYQRPFILGFDNQVPKNGIMLIGSESRGRWYNIWCVL